MTFAPGNRTPWRCRPDAMRRAVRNVVENSVRYGHRARVALEVRGQRALITVDDDGTGISEEDSERVFNPSCAWRVHAIAVLAASAWVCPLPAPSSAARWRHHPGQPPRWRPEGEHRTAQRLSRPPPHRVSFLPAFPRTRSAPGARGPRSSVPGASLQECLRATGACPAKRGP